MLFINDFQNIMKDLLALYFFARSGNTETRAAACQLMFPATTTKPSALVVEAGRRTSESTTCRVDKTSAFRTVVGSGLLRSRYLDCSARPFAKMTEIVQSNPLGIIEPNRHDIWMAADADGLHLSDKQWSRNRKWVPRCLIGTTALSRYKQISKE